MTRRSGTSAPGPVRALALALLDAAETPAVAEELAAEFASLESMLDELQAFEDLLVGPETGAERRRELMERIFEARGDVPPSERKERLSLLGALAEQLHEELGARKGKVDVVVTTAVPLDADELAAVGQDLAKSLKAEPVITARVQPALIAGATVQIGDRVYDASVATRLRMLRERIAERVLENERPDDSGGDE